jgi:hypothetical protein
MAHIVGVSLDRDDRGTGTILLDLLQGANASSNGRTFVRTNHRHIAAPEPWGMVHVRQLLHALDVHRVRGDSSCHCVTGF